MLHSHYLSITSALALAAVLAGSGCSDDSCGPGDSPKTGLLASSAEVVLNFGNIVSGPNNDCTSPDAPMGVVSLTLQGSQVDGPGLLTLCIRRPDLLGSQFLMIGTDVLVIDLRGDVDTCHYEYQSGRPPSGRATANGYCANGTDPAGYSLVVDGNLSLTRTCPTAIDTIAVDFSGEVAIESRP